MKLVSIAGIQELIKTMTVRKLGKQPKEVVPPLPSGVSTESPEATVDQPPPEAHAEPTEQTYDPSLTSSASNDDHGKRTRGARKEKEENNEQTDERGDRWCLYRMSMGVVNVVEHGCGLWGRSVASYPYVAIVLCVAVAALSSVGLMNIHTELRPFRLWIDQSSPFIKVTEWKMKNFPRQYRKHVAIWEADNVLTSEVIKQMWQFHLKVARHTEKLPDDSGWYSVCARVPSIFTYDQAMRRRRRQLGIVNVSDDLSMSLDRKNYCKEIESFNMACYETGLIELWGYEDWLIDYLTDEDILYDINESTISQVFGFPNDFSRYIGGVTYDEKGRIIGAKAALQTWMTAVDEDAVSKGEVMVDLGTGETLDKNGYLWEERLVDLSMEAQKDFPKGLSLYTHASYSFGDVTSATIMSDAQWVGAGWALMFIYVVLTISHNDPINSRVVLSLVGLANVVLAVFVSYGVCSALSIPYSPLNSILPALLVGLGVDDMFVIMASWEQRDMSDPQKSITLQVSGALRHSGVAITVTSLTDVFAFIVGATTSVPALRWFCIYSAVGITAVYVLQATVFVAALSLDRRRLEKSRKKLVLSPKEKTGQDTERSKRPLSRAFRSYSRLLLHPAMQVIVILATIAALATSVWGICGLRQQFNPVWFLPKSSYLYHWFDKMLFYFPGDGEKGSVFFENVDFAAELPNLRKLAQRLEESKYVTQVDAWFNVLEEYRQHHPAFNSSHVDSNTLYDALGLFLHSRSGVRFREHFVFQDELSCLNPAPPFSAFKFEFQFRQLYERMDQQAAMAEVRKLVADSGVKGFSCVWAHVFSQWETDKTVGGELWRNVSVVLGVVALMTLLLLASGRAAVLVLLCVILTLFDVAGVMFFWGLTIDTVSCIALVLAIGLCVDYAAHLAHAFLVAKGPKAKRVEDALAGVGAAVLHGGLSTLIAFLLLAPSDSHIFVSFFKIFTTVALFGLYHGLVLLPVLLLFVGPASYLENITTSTSTEASNENSNSEIFKGKDISDSLPVITYIPNEMANWRCHTNVCKEGCDIHNTSLLSPKHLLSHPNYSLTACPNHHEAHRFAKPEAGQDSASDISQESVLSEIRGSSTATDGNTTESTVSDIEIESNRGCDSKAQWKQCTNQHSRNIKDGGNLISASPEGDVTIDMAKAPKYISPQLCPSEESSQHSESSGECPTHFEPQEKSSSKLSRNESFLHSHKHHTSVYVNQGFVDDAGT